MIELSLLLIGLQFGATACALSCLPIMTPILLLSNDNKQKALYTLFSYFSGKLLAYITIAVIAFYIGNMVKNYLDSSYIDRFSAGVIFGVGVYFFIQAIQNKKRSCTSNCNAKLKYGYFLIGYLSSFSFCVPLATLIATVISVNTLLDSLIFGAFFGLGVVFVPFLLLYFFIYQITSQVRENLLKYQFYLEIFSSSILILLSITIYFGYFHL